MTLRDFVDKGRVDLFLTEVIDREVIADLRERSKDAQNAIRRTLKDHPFLQHSPKVPFDALTRKDSLSDLTDIVLARWDKWKRVNHATVLSVKHVDADTILKAYFAENPPFGVGNKKAEFPDAFTMHSAIRWCEDTGEKMIVVSKDNDIRRFCEAHDGRLEHVASLAEALEAFTDATVAAKLHAGFEEMEPEIADAIREEFEGRAFTAYEFDGDVENIEIIEIGFDDLHIMEADAGRGTAEVQFGVRFTASVCHNDPDSGMWDKEDQQMIFVERVTTEVEEEVVETAYIDFNYDEGDPDEIEVDRISFSGGDIDVDLNRYIYPG